MNHTQNRLERYINSYRKNAQITAEEFEKYTQVQCDRILEINAQYIETKRHQKIYCDELMAVNIEYVKSDREFYVIPCADIKHRHDWQMELNIAYQTFNEPMMHIQSKYLCAVYDGLNWYRGEIIDNTFAKVMVFLLDYGRTITVTKNDICILKCPHGSIQPFVLKCQLTTFNTDTNDLTVNENKHSIKKQFKVIAQNAKNVWLYFNGLVPQKTNTFDVLLLTDFQNNANMINNAYILHEAYGAFNRQKILLDSQLCEEWCDEIPKITNRTHISNKKMRVYLSFIESPTEIYVKHETAVRFMPTIRRKIDAYVKSMKQNAKWSINDSCVKWSIGDRCLVRMQNWNTKCKMLLWYRGQIIKIDAKKHKIYTVFLCDHGRRTDAKSIDLMQIPPEMANCDNAIQKTSLCISEQWLNTSTEWLNNLVEQYESFAITCESKNGSTLNIELFATNHTPDIYNADVWTNIGVNIISMSLRKSLEPFIVKTQQRYRNRMRKCINDHHLSSDDPTTHQYTDDFTTNINMLKYNLVPTSSKWLPPLPIEQRTFNGLVTHITKTGVVYIQKESDIDTVIRMCAEISQYINMSNGQPVNSLEWRVGNICYAEFEANIYYRATIKHIYRENGTCLIKYVDFGTQAVRHLDYLHAVTVFDIHCSIPILAHRLFVPNLVPNLKNGHWSPVILKAFSNHLIQEYCECTVENYVNGIRLTKLLPCAIDPLTQPCKVYQWIRHEKLAHKCDLNAENEEILFVG